MHARFAAEGKPGVTMRTGSNYSTWWNGGLRTTAYFHNQIGLLTETIGNPTPIEIPFVPERQLPSADLPYPDRAAALAVPPVDRLLGDGQPRGARCGVALSRDAAVQHLPDGEERHRARQPRLVDGLATRRGPPHAARGDFERQFRDPARRDRARLHPAVRSAGLPDGDEVHRRAAQDRRHRPSRDRRVHGERQDAIRPARSS